MGEWAKQVSNMVQITDGIVDKTITIYHADAASDPPLHPRVRITGVHADGSAFVFDEKFADLNISDSAQAAINTALENACAAVFALRGYTPPQPDPEPSP